MQQCSHLEYFQLVIRQFVYRFRDEVTNNAEKQNSAIIHNSYNLFNMMETQNCSESIILTASLSKEALRHTKLKYDSFGLEIVQTVNNILHPGDKVKEKRNTDLYGLYW